MVLLLIGSIIMLPFTIYSIIKKPKIPISSDFEKMEKEINDWLTGRAYGISEKFSAETDPILTIEQEAVKNTASSEQIPYFPWKTIGDDY